MAEASSNRDDETPERLSDSLPLLPTLIALWMKRRLVLGMGIGTALLGAALAFALPSEYKSMATLMPPEASSLSPQSALNLNGPSISLGASLASQRTVGSTVIGILSSDSERLAIIDHLNLMPVYRTQSRDDALKKLAARTVFLEDKKSGILSITVTDRDRVRARDIAQAYVDELDHLLNRLNTSSARKERLFLQERLNEVHSQLEQSSKALSNFASSHETLNPTSQGAVLIQAQSLLRNELLTAEAELASLRTTYNDGNVRVRAAAATVSTLKARLKEMSASPGSDRRNPSNTPSLRELPLLSVTYGDLSREVATQQTLFETLTKQLEIAKVQEAKEISTAKELDYPRVAERRSFPSRWMFGLGGFVIGLLLSSIYLIAISASDILEQRYQLRSFLSDSFAREEQNI